MSDKLMNYNEAIEKAIDMSILITNQFFAVLEATESDYSYKVMKHSPSLGNSINHSNYPIKQLFLNGICVYNQYQSQIDNLKLMLNLSNVWIKEE